MSAQAHATGSSARPACRMARRQDAASIWSLVRDTGVLDVNSPYCYLLACEELADTCVVAEDEGSLVGFVMALRLPQRPEAIFVWQVGVAESQRGRGLARRLLEKLVTLPSCRDVTHLEATVTPSNEPSRALFRSFARRAGAFCEVRPYFSSVDFPTGNHEAEELFRIGPLPRRDPREVKP